MQYKGQGEVRTLGSMWKTCRANLLCKGGHTVPGEKYTGRGERHINYHNTKYLFLTGQQVSVKMCFTIPWWGPALLNHHTKYIRLWVTIATVPLPHAKLAFDSHWCLWILTACLPWGGFLKTFYTPLHLGADQYTHRLCLKPIPLFTHSLLLIIMETKQWVLSLDFAHHHFCIITDCFLHR